MTLNPRQRLEMLLKGAVPDVPPHFELVFQLEKEMFNMDWQTVREGVYSSAEQKRHAGLVFYEQICCRLIDQMEWAAVPAMGYEFPEDQCYAIKHLKKHLGDKAMVFAFSSDGVFWMPTGEEMMDFVVTLFERPDEMHRRARQKCQAAKELSRRQADAGVDFIVQNTDFGFNQGPFISPKQFNEFVIPYMTEIIEVIHDLKIPVILHSDGDLREILQPLYQTGVDGFQSVDPQAHMDIKTVRQQYPDWLLMGNVACNLMQDADENQIRNSVRYCMEQGGVGKRYIFSTSNCIFSGMPAESYKIMLDEYKAICRKSRAR